MLRLQRLVKRQGKGKEEEDQPASRQPRGVQNTLPYAHVVKNEFPSLNTNQLPSAHQSSTWGPAPGGRSMAPIQRNQPTPSSQQGQQDDFFSSSRGLQANQSPFRFAPQGNIGQASQPQPGSSDEFPPLNNGSSFRNGNGDIGQERGSTLMSTLGFGAQGSPATNSIQGNRGANGLLNALSANNRTAEVSSPDIATPVSARPLDVRSPIGSSEPRQKPPGFREDSLASQSAVQDSPTQAIEGRNPLGAIGNDAPNAKAKEDKDNQLAAAHDPLAGMAPIDKWGIKGLRTMMNNFPDYNAMATGFDLDAFGLNLKSPEPISNQIYSLTNDAPPRPAVPKYQLPECYTVSNVQPLENKIQSFNDETLMMMFYSSPNDYKQQWAATELNNRNWRWHKKLQFWLTKDETVAPRPVSVHHEEGIYIVWDPATWRKERRQLILYYADLETVASR